jgi:hypothetical protein
MDYAVQHILASNLMLYLVLPEYQLMNEGDPVHDYSFKRDHLEPYARLFAARCYFTEIYGNASGGANNVGETFLAGIRGFPYPVSD